MNKIKSFFERIGKKIFPLTAKKIAISLVCIIIFLTPTLLAMSQIFADDSEYIEDTFSVKIYDSEHNLIASEESNPNVNKTNSLADIFYRIFTLSKKSDRAPFPPEEVTPIYAKTELNGTYAEYTCYFSFLTASSYYTDSLGQTFIIGIENASAFLSSQYAESLYLKAAPPKLYTNTDTQIIPATASWFYQLNDDSYQEALNCETTSEARLYEFSSILGLDFEEAPDECLVRIFEDGSMIYEGELDGVASLAINSSSPLRINIHAKWNEKENAVCHGEVTYSFTASIRDRTQFTLNGDTLYPHSFIILSCTNIKNISDIKYSSNSDFSPHFCRDGDTVRALIPYHKLDGGDTSLEFTITYGASSKRFSIPLGESASKATHILSTTDSKLEHAMSNNARSEVLKLIGSVASHSTDTVYFRGNIRSPEDYGFSAGYGFNTELLSFDQQSFTSAYGNEYIAAESGQSIRALCSGEVITVGKCAALGNYAIVSHGMGLFTWYCHLSDVDVDAGNIVALGDLIGKAGNGALSDNNGVLIMCTVENTLIDPSNIVGKTLKY